MSLKVVNLIAVETGVLVGLVSWIAYSHFPSAQSRTEAGNEERLVAPVRNVSSVTRAASASGSGSYSVSPSRYSPEREQARLMAERAASLAASQRYYQTTATQPYTTSESDNGTAIVETPSYSYEEQPAEYIEPAPAVVYYAAPIQTVVVSNPRHFRDRCRTDIRRGGIDRTPRQCPPAQNPRNDNRLVSVPKNNVPSPRPPQAARPRGTVTQVSVPPNQEKRSASPSSQKNGRRSASVP